MFSALRKKLQELMAPRQLKVGEHRPSVPDLAHPADSVRTLSGDEAPLPEVVSTEAVLRPDDSPTEAAGSEARTKPLPSSAEPPADDSISLPEYRATPIRELVAESEGSVRLKNAIRLAEALPAETVEAYMANPAQAYDGFLRLQNIGRKTARELHELVAKAASGALPGRPIAPETETPEAELDPVRPIYPRIRQYAGPPSQTAQLRADHLE